MPETALFVDDEEYILHSLDRLFLDHSFRILKAGCAQEALDIIQHEEIAVIVSDNMMPGMNGIELLSKVKEVSPDTIKIMMTAHADLTTAVDAINRGEVFRFIVKPWKNKELVQIVQDAMNRYQLIHSLKKADEATLLSLAQTIELKDPYTRGHCDRVASYALMIADAYDLPEEIKKEIKYGSWLHDCGKIGIPEEILNSTHTLSDEQFSVIEQHPSWGADVARQARLSEGIIHVILYHHEKYNGTGYPNNVRGENIPFVARIVSVADVFDAITTDRPYKKGSSIEKGLDILHKMKGIAFDPEIIETFLTLSRQLGFGAIHHSNEGERS